MRAYERFLDYVKVHTTSDDTTGTHPSTSGQFDLAPAAGGSDAGTGAGGGAGG